MKARCTQKSPSRSLLREMFMELGHVVQQSIADSWLVRISLATMVFIIFSFIFTRLINVLTTEGFGPHGACLLWLPGLITLYVGSDTLIGLAYVSISATLIYLVYKTRRTIPFQWVFVAFGIFIIACGTTHFLDVWTLWVPTYWLSGTVKLLTALASVTTALALPPLVPKVLDLIQLASVSDERKRRLEQAHNELEVLYEKSQNLDRLKTTFFTNVSHDLRTPLTLILGPIDALLTAQQLTEQQRRTLGVVQRNALTLLKRVNDLLIVAQLEAGQMALNITEIDLARLLQGCAAHFEILAQDRQITFTVEGLTSVLAYLDAEKFQHICLNLLSNAFKFVPDGGRVRCVLSQEGEWGIITVQDNGPGIRSELRQAIFERFWQGEDNLTRRFEGTGLGLAIVKELVELHNGISTVGNAPEGGALFTVKLPLDAVTPACSQPSLLQSPVNEEQAALFLTDLSPVPKYEADSVPTGQSGLKEGSQTLVLVVDDHQEMARFLVDILAPEYRVAVAGDGLDGLEKALTLQPDLILCDIMMPHMSGEQFITQVRAHSALDGIPIIVLSARADDALRIQLLCEGASEYLVKPFFPEELRAKAATLIAMKLTRQVLQQEVTTQDQNLVILAREVTLRKRESQQALEELRRVNKQLIHASQVQRNFVAIVSHECRTSLASVQGFAELMRDEMLSPEEMKEFAADIFIEAKRLGRMLTDLLDLERMKSGRMQLIREPVKLNALIREVLEHLRPISSQHTFNLQLDEALPDCQGDKDKLAQVVTNLLSNAIKYSPDGGEIVVGSQLEQEMVRVWVQDHGIGIPPESLEEVFIPYSRIEAGTTRYIKGTGLGLSIVRQVIQIHGGHIWVESSLGQGSRFHFTVPLA
ncbi:MAG: response regulator [Chloroflexi bacterium]|nr:MAG: response regulator [Chloroflexota bacterium]